QKFRDELRARGGLLRVREFLMKDSYSFHASEADFKQEYQNMRETYQRIFSKLQLKALVVEADNGYIGGDYCHEFVVEHPAGESRFLMTEDGTYAAHEDVAVFAKNNQAVTPEPCKPLTEVAAVREATMAAGVVLHQIPLTKHLKNVLYVDENQRLVLAVLRGDLSVNETKLKHVAAANTLRMATAEEIANINSVAGFLSPVGITKAVYIVADDSTTTLINACSGANKFQRDYLNINIKRDYTPNVIGDIAMAEAGYVTKSKQTLVERRGIEVGNIFQLGYHYSKLMQANFINQAGQAELYYMGCYGIGVDRTLATIVELFHDDKGICWPEIVSPFKFHLLNLNKDSVQSDKVYQALQKVGFEVLYDDRVVSAGIKLNDADLIGITYRLIVGAKTGNNIEYKSRSSKQAELISLTEIIKRHVQ
ncbi:MAG: proline--tRNA ligase, partial [Patescibacteria group bacterium]